MILILLTIVFLSLGITWVKKDWTSIKGTMFIIFGIITSCIVIVIFCVCSLTANYETGQNNIKYESLCKRLEVINSEYEDVSKSEVIKDVYLWNEKVYRWNYWNNNL
jgi:hypothetical protein